MGDLLYSTILSYFALNDAQDIFSQFYSGSIGYRAPSYGLLKTSLDPIYWYGIPQKVSLDGLVMDVDRMSSLQVDKQNNLDDWQTFNRAQGARISAMEHLVPEQMFSTEKEPANGISAVKAIQMAAQEGQQIYTITQANVDVALQKINFNAEIEADIRSAAYAGMEIITHQRSVNFFGNSSAGYIILDPDTGAGAYRIWGGENGGSLSGAIEKKLGWNQYMNKPAAASLSSDYTSRYSAKSITLGMLDSVYECYEEDINGTTIAIVALIVIAAIVLSMVVIALTGGGAAVALGVALRYAIVAILGMSTISAHAAGGRYICDLKCQVYRTDDPLKGIIGYTYGSACGTSVSDAWNNAKRKAGEHVNNNYGPGHGYRHCTEPSFACRKR